MTVYVAAPLLLEASVTVAVGAQARAAEATGYVAAAELPRASREIVPSSVTLADELKVAVIDVFAAEPLPLNESGDRSMSLVELCAILGDTVNVALAELDE